MRAYNVVCALDDAGLKVRRLCARAPHHHAQGHLLLHGRIMIEKGKISWFFLLFLSMYTVKNVSDIPFPSPAGMSFNNFFLGGNNLVSDILAGVGNVANLFYGVVVQCP